MQIWAAIIGGLFAVLAAVVAATITLMGREGWQSFFRKLRDASNSRRGLLLILAGVTLTAALGFGVYWVTVRLGSNPPIVNINSHRDHAEIWESEAVVGTSKNLGKEQVVWLTVVPTGGRYCPHDKAASDLGGGRWRSQVDFAQPGEADIIVVAAGPKAQSVFKDYAAKCQDTGECLGIDKLPEDAVIPSGLPQISIIARKLPMIAITSPKNGDRLQQTVTVRGKVQYLLEGQEVWIFVVPARVGWYYPQGNPVVVTGDRSRASGWQRVVGLGSGPNDPERRFDIVAVVAGEKAQSVFEGHVRRCRQGTCPGIPKLPEDTEPRAKIAVARR